jgi:hypothetical protein
MNRSASSVVLLASSLLCLLPSARSQNPAPAPTFTTTAPSNKPEEALRSLDRDDVGQGPVDALSFAEVAAQAPPEQAIPVIERFYEKHKNDPPDDQLGVPHLRDNLASLLVQLGDPNPVYWNVLVSEADLALSSEVPYPNLTNGKTLEDAFTPEQKAWAKAHNTSPQQMFRDAMMVVPQRFAPLAKTGDPRALPILRTGLKSENLMIQSLAADGLGLLRDKDSIPVIVAICRARQAPLAYFIADSLLYFHDPTADKVYHEYFPDVDIEKVRQFKGDSPWVGTVHHPFGQNSSTPEPPRSSTSAPDAAPAPPPQTPPDLDTALAPDRPRP